MKLYHKPKLFRMLVTKKACYKNKPFGRLYYGG